VATSKTAQTVKPEAEKPRLRRAYLPAAERRKSIIAAAQQVFARQNLKGARTRDIARAAQVNQATIFEHFESKEALFHAAVVQPLIDAMQGMHGRVEVYETAATPDELARLAVESGQRHIADAIAIFPLLVAALFSEPELGQRLYREHIAPLVRQRGRVLDSVARDGLDRDFIGLANFGMLFAIAMDTHLGDHEGAAPDVEHLARLFTRMATGGFARDKEREAITERIDGPAT